MQGLGVLSLLTLWVHALTKLELIEEIDTKFEDEVEGKELSNLCDF